MPTVSDVLSAVEELAPPRFAFAFDKVGHQIGDPRSEVSGVVVTLDCSMGCIDFAESVGANVIVAHHPLIFAPLSSLVIGNLNTDIVTRLVKSGIALISVHTNWDCAPGGVSDSLAAALKLENVHPIGSMSESTKFKLVTFVPVDFTESVIDALATAGAGDIGAYSRCAFTVEGSGTFKGGVGSNPVIGTPGHIEVVQEHRLEMVVPSDKRASVVAALRSTHPYEEPAFDIVPLQGSSGHPISRIGVLPTSMTEADLVSHVTASLGSVCRAHPGGKGQISKVAVSGGAASDEWHNALSAGADAFVTGEVKHHNALEASAMGMTIIEAGHFATEQPGVRALAVLLQANLGNNVVSVFEPKAGEYGRPIG